MSTIQESTTLGKLRTRGYWRVVIRPTTFQKDRVPNFTDLFPIVERNSVQLRGWDYPHVNHRTEPLRGQDWVGQEFDEEDEIELWRLYMSGQFIHFFAMAGDWRDLSSSWPAEPDWAPGRELDYIQTIYAFVEIFEFANRLALSPAGGEQMRVSIELDRLGGRRIVARDQSIFLRSYQYAPSMDRWEHRWEGPKTDLVVNARKLAALATKDLFARSGLDVSEDVLIRLQDTIGR